MRLYLLGAVLCLAIIQCYPSPIAPKEAAIEKSGEKQEETLGVFKETASTEAAPSEPTSTTELATPTEKTPRSARQNKPQESDDDDDDDDDDLGLGVDDDDDDDDEESADDDDDDDDDYFGSFFDDILGGDDDDDDDDDEDDEPATPVQSPSVAADTPVAVTPEALPAASISEELDAADAAAEEQSEGTVEPAESLIEKDPQVADEDDAVENNVQPAVETVQADTTVDDDDDDDDDEDDDALGGITGDDDDDDDDDEEADDDDDDDEDDEDDDDDDTSLDDVIEAKRSRALAQPAPKMPAVYISKYNRFVDNIIGRINNILGKSYDPVRVKLLSQSGGNSTKKQTAAKKKRKTGSKVRTAPKEPDARNKMGELAIARSTESESREPSFILISKNAATNKSVVVKSTAEQRENKKNKTSSKKKKGSAKGTKQTKKKAPKARATLFGLSSLKRDGDVNVNMQSDHTTVKTNFILGPLTLRVEREIGRGAKRELKSATATTAEMHGRLNLRIVHGGAATLHSIRVLQPKQVRVDSADNHEKTKEFMWKRSSNIATLVSQKLASAARSMLKPPPAA